MIDFSSICEKFPDVIISVSSEPRGFVVDVRKRVEGHVLSARHVFAYAELWRLPDYIVRQVIEELCEKIEKETVVNIISRNRRGD